MGMLERKGEVRAMVVRTTRRMELEGKIREHVSPGSTAYTDALKSYRALREDYVHDFVDTLRSTSVAVSAWKTSGACLSAD